MLYLLGQEWIEKYTKKENSYWYLNIDKKKKFAYRYRLYDHNDMRKEKEKKKQNFNTSLEEERTLTVLKATIEWWRKNCS